MIASGAMACRTDAVAAPRLSVESLTKRFGAVAANDGVSFMVAAGELHCLLGENGAGKSTLIGCIFGSHHPDSGCIMFDGRVVAPRSPADASRLGIAVVHQHFVLIPRFTVLQNVTLGARACGLKLGRAAAERRCDALRRDLGLTMDLHARVETLSVGEQQWVEILKALYLDTRLLLLDEPTAVLTPQESDRLFAVLRLLTARGISVVLISHKFDEVMQADRVTVLRRGRTIATIDPRRTTKAELAALMVGRSVSFAPDRTPHAVAATPMLDVRNLALGPDAALSFAVRGGEILGIAGVAGNGQDALFETLAGSRPADRGAVILDGVDMTTLPPPARAALGLGVVPGDRYRDGLVGAFSIADNLVLGRQHHRLFARRGFLDRARIAAFARDCVERFEIAPPAIDLPAGKLSGGNAQKLVLAREFDRAAKCLLCHQPTRGLDVGIVAFVHRRLIEKRDQGCAILLASEELDEMLALCDRIMVLFRGRIMGIVDAASATREALGLMMAGQVRSVEAGD